MRRQQAILVREGLKILSRPIQSGGGNVVAGQDALRSQSNRDVPWCGSGRRIPHASYRRESPHTDYYSPSGSSGIWHLAENLAALWWWTNYDRLAIEIIEQFTTTECRNDRQHSQ